MSQNSSTHTNEPSNPSSSLLQLITLCNTSDAEKLRYIHAEASTELRRRIKSPAQPGADNLFHDLDALDLVRILEEAAARMTRMLFAVQASSDEAGYAMETLIGN